MASRWCFFDWEYTSVADRSAYTDPQQALAAALRGHQRRVRGRGLHAFDHWFAVNKLKIVASFVAYAAVPRVRCACM